MKKILLIILVILVFGCTKISEVKEKAEGYTEESNGIECGYVNVKFFLSNGGELICYEESEDVGSIRATIEAGSEIHSITLEVLGEKDTYKTDILDFNLKAGDVKRMVSMYDFSIYGNIKQVKIIPRIMPHGRIISCGDIALVKEKINEC